MVAQDFGKHQLKAYIQKLKQRVRSLAPCLVIILVLFSQPLTNICKSRSWLFTRQATGAVISFLQGLHIQVQTNKGLMAPKFQKPPSQPVASLSAKCPPVFQFLIRHSGPPKASPTKAALAGGFSSLQLSFPIYPLQLLLSLVLTDMHKVCHSLQIIHASQQLLPPPPITITLLKSTHFVPIPGFLGVMTPFASI